MNKVIVFGTGLFWNNHKETVQTYSDIVCFLDNNSSKIGACLDGKIIESPQNVNNYEYDIVLIMSQYEKQMKEQLVDLGVSEENIWTYDKYVCEMYKSESYVFANRQRNRKKLCVVLAGYKPALYESVFGRIHEYLEGDIDVCVATSGVYSAELDTLCEQNGWSYLRTKKNSVALIQNLAIILHPQAEYIFKLDEDIFITKGYFKKMYDHYLKIESEGLYNVGILAPVIPINGYGHMKVLEKLGLEKYYEEHFEKPKYAAGRDRMVETNPDAARFFWGAHGIVPNIDELNIIFENDIFRYSVCPIRFSIGAILFSRKIFMDMGMLKVLENSVGMGLDEEQICSYCICDSKPIIVQENTVVGHLSFTLQNEAMMQYYEENKTLFGVRKEPTK